MILNIAVITNILLYLANIQIEIIITLNMTLLGISIVKLEHRAKYFYNIKQTNDKYLDYALQSFSKLKHTFKLGLLVIMVQNTLHTYGYFNKEYQPLVNICSWCLGFVYLIQAERAMYDTRYSADMEEI